MRMVCGRLRYPCKDLLTVMEPVPSYEDLIWLFEAEPVYRYADDEREAGYIWPAELDLMAQLAGFELESRHADWTKTPFTAESRSHVSVYRKEAGNQ